MSENQESFPAIYCEDYDAAEKAGVGAFFYDEDPDTAERAGLFFKLPGEDYYRGIEVSRSGRSSGVWKLEGKKESPTTHPSINALQTGGSGKSGSYWHGWLREGRFRSC